MTGSLEEDEDASDISVQTTNTISSQPRPTEHALDCDTHIVVIEEKQEPHKDSALNDAAQEIIDDDDDDDDTSVPIVSPYEVDVHHIAEQLSLTEELLAEQSHGNLNGSSPSSSSTKKRNPIETCNWLSYLTWYWVGDIFRVGKHHRLTHADLDPIPQEDDAERLNQRWEHAWNTQQQQHPEQCPSVWYTVWLVFGWKIIWRCLPLLLVSLAKISQPLILKQMVLFIQANDNDDDVSSQGPVGLAYAYAIMLTIASILQSVIQHQYFFNMFRTGAQLRITLSTAIYKQALTLQTTHFLSTSTGGLTNLIAADTSKFEEFCLYIFYLIDAPIEGIIVLLLLIDNIGISGLVGFGVLLACIPIQTTFSKLFSIYRKRAVVHTDQRVKTIHEILSAAEVIKCYAYEKPLEQVVDHAREQEFKWIQRATFLKGANQAIFFFSSPLMNLLTFVTYYELGHQLSPAAIFTSVAFFNVVRLPITTYLPYAVQALSETKVAVSRIQTFMELGWKDQQKRQAAAAAAVAQQQHSNALPDPPMGSSPRQSNSSGENSAVVRVEIPASFSSAPVVGSVVLRDASFKWDASSKETAGLFDLTVNVPVGCLTGVLGAIGAGKSSFLCALLGEMAQLQGERCINGRLAYASQQSCIFAGSIRDNILLGRNMNYTRYLRTLYACCLIPDLLLFPAHDLTEIGEKGVTLSGGQRARVNLARCVYADVDVYLFDDVLAALDAVVARRVFMNCVSDDGLLVGKTRIVVTHQTHFLHKAAHLVVLDKGRIKAQGTWTELVRQEEIRKIIHVTGQEDKQEERRQAKRQQRLRKQQAVQSVSSPHANGHSTASVSDSINKDATVVKKKEKAQSIMSEEVSSVGTVSLGVYFSLFRSGHGAAGLFYAASVVGCLFCLCQAVSITSDRWLSIWSQQDTETQANLLYLHVYIALVGSTILLGIIRSDLFFRMLLRGASTLHNQMFRGVLYSSMRWFESNPTGTSSCRERDGSTSAGRVLNRFSKDQSIVDELLPPTMFDALQSRPHTTSRTEHTKAILLSVDYDFLIHSHVLCLCVCILSVFWMCAGAIASVASVSPYILAVVAPLIPIFIWLRRHYLSTSREIKRLDATTRSPVYAAFSSTLSGLITIRAFHVTDDFFHSFLHKLNINTAATFTFMTTTRWFGVRLDFLATLLVLATGLLMIGLRNNITAAAAGFSLAYSLLLTSLFQWGVRQTAEVENQMTAAERLMQYGQLPREGVFEPPAEGQVVEEARLTVDGVGDSSSTSNLTPVKQHRLVVPPPSWPSTGQIVFDHYSMRYRPGLDLVIKGLTLDIKHKQKIGVCGRTGAGKSSLFQSICRLVDAADGRIVIDDYDIADLPLTTLRSSLSIIPQSPVIFSNTLRYNLDPFNQHSTTALWQALQAVQLSTMVTNLNQQLDTFMAEGGSNFSVGECQLVCVARALLKSSCILLVDEATANVDLRTDQLIQEIIRKQFADRTVITIAHRLPTILSSDRIMVMEAGRVVEFDTPEKLLEKQGGVFRDMLQQSQHARRGRVPKGSNAVFHVDNDIYGQ